MTGREKVLNVEAQVREIAGGERSLIECPYCNCVSTMQNGFLCCEPLSEVVLAVVGHMQFIDRTEALERTLEELDKQQQKVLLN